MKCIELARSQSAKNEQRRPMFLPVDRSEVIDLKRWKKCSKMFAFEAFSHDFIFFIHRIVWKSFVWFEYKSLIFFCLKSTKSGNDGVETSPTKSSSTKKDDDASSPSTTIDEYSYWFFKKYRPFLIYKSRKIKKLQWCNAIIRLAVLWNLLRQFFIFDDKTFFSKNQ